MDTLWICEQKERMELLLRYSKDAINIIDTAWGHISKTRKSGKIADGIILKELEYWQRFEKPVVMESIRRYITQRCAEKGYNEKYLRGIMRGVAKEKTAPAHLQKHAGRAGIADQLDRQKADLHEWLSS